MEFLDIPLFDDDFYKMIFRFSINIFFLFIIIRVLYYKSSERKDYLFTYFMIGIIVFFLCFTLKKYELDIGMALGLFAIFGIIRYRTSSIAIKEMTYLFVVIGVSVINSLANQKMSYAEIFSGNIIITGAIFIMERVWRVNNEESKRILYEQIENVKPENYHLLRKDLEERTGLKINNFLIEEIDFLKDTAIVIINYNKNQVAN
jgi:hypothetical protein